jgi:hypothetical protein
MKMYSSPEMLKIDLYAEDICTVSAGTLADNEFENKDQWWFDFTAN